MHHPSAGHQWLRYGRGASGGFAPAGVNIKELGCPRKLGSKVRISAFLTPSKTRFISRWNNPSILTIDPNFLGHQGTVFFLVWVMKYGWWQPEIRQSPVDIVNIPLFFRVLAPSQAVGNGISELSTVPLISTGTQNLAGDTSSTRCIDAFVFWCSLVVLFATVIILHISSVQWHNRCGTIAIRYQIPFNLSIWFYLKYLDLQRNK